MSTSPIATLARLRPRPLNSTYQIKGFAELRDVSEIDDGLEMAVGVRWTSLSATGSGGCSGSSTEDHLLLKGVQQLNVLPLMLARRQFVQFDDASRTSWTEEERRAWHYGRK